MPGMRDTAVIRARSPSPSHPNSDNLPRRDTWPEDVRRVQQCRHPPECRDLVDKLEVWGVLADPVQNLQPPDAVTRRLDSMQQVPNFGNLLEAVVHGCSREARLDIAFVVVDDSARPIALWPLRKRRNCVLSQDAGI